MLKVVVIIILTAAFLPSVKGQDADPYISDFLAVQQEDAIFLRWTISAGNTCDGTRIQRSVDGIIYEEIGEIPGVCGSPDQSITYDFTDTAPVRNRVNYYRLELGLLGLTSAEAVEFIILNNEGYSIQPNPVFDKSIFLFDNPDGEEHELCLTDMSGKVVMTMLTTSDRFIIDGNLLRAGNYIFKLRKDGVILKTGKIASL